jgi:hypothetical protein
MRTTTITTLALLCMTVTLVHGTGSIPLANAPVPPTCPVEIRFADGSLVRMELLDAQIQIITRYGKLAVPVTDLRKIDFAFRCTEATQKKIDDAIGLLGHTNYRDREAATQTLLDLRELAYPAVLRATKSTDREVAQRAEEVLASLKERLNAEQLKPREHDSIQTAEFPIVGRIQTQVLRVRTAYFGEVQLDIATMRSLRSLGSHSDKVLSVDAARYAHPTNGDWLDTGVELTGELSLEIIATGTIDLWPNRGSDGQYTATPAGTSQYGSVQRPGVIGSAGALIGRIGENGQPFVVGTRYENPRPTAGKLYLRITPSPWNNESRGEYNVRISLGGR